MRGDDYPSAKLRAGEQLAYSGFLKVPEVKRHLSVIEELEATVEANLTRVDRLRQSILGKAFTGRLVTRKGCEMLC